MPFHSRVILCHQLAEAYHSHCEEPSLSHRFATYAPSQSTLIIPWEGLCHNSRGTASISSGLGSWETSSLTFNWASQYSFTCSIKHPTSFVGSKGLLSKTTSFRPFQSLHILNTSNWRISTFLIHCSNFLRNSAQYSRKSTPSIRCISSCNSLANQKSLAISHWKKNMDLDFFLLAIERATILYINTSTP